MTYRRDQARMQAHRVDTIVRAAARANELELDNEHLLQHTGLHSQGAENHAERIKVLASWLHLDHRARFTATPQLDSEGFDLDTVTHAAKCESCSPSLVVLTPENHGLAAWQDAHNAQLAKGPRPYHRATNPSHAAGPSLPNPEGWNEPGMQPIADYGWADPTGWPGHKEPGERGEHYLNMTHDPIRGGKLT